MKSKHCSVVLPFLLAACEPQQFEMTAEKAKHNYSTVVYQDETSYLKHRIYDNELIPLIPLISYLNHKDRKNAENGRIDNKVRMFSFTLKETSIQDLLFVLRPLEGYFNDRNCDQLSKHEIVAFSPEIITYYAVKNSQTLNPKSLKVQSTVAQLEESFHDLIQIPEVEWLLQTYLKRNGVSLSKELGEKKRQLISTLKDIVRADNAMQVFMNPKVIFCKNFELKDLVAIEKMFKKFNMQHKPLDFNKKLKEQGYYD